MLVESLLLRCNSQQELQDMSDSTMAADLRLSSSMKLAASSIWELRANQCSLQC